MKVEDVKFVPFEASFSRKSNLNGLYESRESANRNNIIPRRLEQLQKLEQ